MGGRTRRRGHNREHRRPPRRGRARRRPGRVICRLRESRCGCLPPPGRPQCSLRRLYGPVPGSVYAGHRFIDVLIHGWDLATATGQGPVLDARLMETCRQIIDRNWKRSGEPARSPRSCRSRRTPPPDPVPGDARPQPMMPIPAIGPVHQLPARPSSRQSPQPHAALTLTAHNRTICTRTAVPPNQSGAALNRRSARITVQLFTGGSLRSVSTRDPCRAGAREGKSALPRPGHRRCTSVGRPGISGTEATMHRSLSRCRWLPVRLPGSGAPPRRIFRSQLCLVSAHTLGHRLNGVPN